MKLKVFFTTCILFLALCVPARADVITLASDYWCPYICDPATTGHHGISVDVARIVFEKAGHTIRFVEVNWKRAIADTREGKYNAIVDATSEDAPDFVLPEEPINSQFTCLFAAPDSTWKFHGMESLEEVRLGVISGYHYTDALDAYIDREQAGGKVDVMHGGDALIRNVEKVRRGMIDVLAEDPAVIGWTLLSQNDGDGLLRVGCLDQEIPLYIAFSPVVPQSQEYARILSEGIRRLKKDGTLKKIYLEYGIDWTAE